MLALSGRVHHYEGHDMQTVTFAMRALGRLGVPRVILTNAAGGISPNCSRGALMVIDDHINLMGNNPLVGPNDERFGLRFPDMTNVYSPRLREHRRRGRDGASASPIQHGVYIAVLGPSYETPAEIRAFRTLGADAVGMSTAPEAIVGPSHGHRGARHLVHHQRRGRRLSRAAASFGSDGDRAAGEGAVHRAARGDHWPALTHRLRQRRWSAGRRRAAAREHAVADFSHFKVGAALETDTGEIITGCNVENATYGLTICAERVAIFKALSEGQRAFTRIAVVADTAVADAAVRRLPADHLGVLRRHRQWSSPTSTDVKTTHADEGPAAVAVRSETLIVRLNDSIDRDLKSTCFRPLPGKVTTS